MRIVHTSVLVLTVGILSSSIAPGYCSPSQNGLLQSIFDLTYSPRSSNFNTSDDNAEAMMKLLRESCEKNGGPEEYDTARNFWRDFSRCEKQAESHVKEMHSSTAADDLVINVKKYCSMIAIEENCVKKLKDTIKPCLELKDREHINIFYSMMMLSLGFICEMDGARITKFIDDGGVQCWKSKRQDLQNCASDISSTISSESPSEVLDFVLDINDCINIEKYQKCSVKVMNGCKHHTPAEIMDALFNSVTRGMGCEKLHKSEASAASVVDTVLITIAMAIFLHFE